MIQAVVVGWMLLYMLPLLQDYKVKVVKPARKVVTVKAATESDKTPAEVRKDTNEATKN
jgi:hypothetical protein